MSNRCRLKEAMNDDFIFCQAVPDALGVRIAHELQLTSASVRYRMKKGGQITGFAQVTKPYNLRDGAAKALNESCKCLPTHLTISTNMGFSTQRMSAIHSRILSYNIRVSTPSSNITLTAKLMPMFRIYIAV